MPVKVDLDIPNILAGLVVLAPHSLHSSGDTYQLQLWTDIRRGMIVDRDSFLMYTA